jgi:hypothetical protein
MMESNDAIVRAQLVQMKHTQSQLANRMDVMQPLPDDDEDEVVIVLLISPNLCDSCWKLLLSMSITAGACGTGACAAVAVGQQQGNLDEQVTVRLPGGELKIRWQGEGQTLLMTGPAATVFHGSISII